MTPLIDQFPADRLDVAEEARLARLAQKGDEESANKLVLATMREALRYTQRVCNNKIGEQDRVSLCYRKLMMCVQRFDPKRGLRFFAFSKAALRGQMKTYWENQDAVRNATKMFSVDVLSGWQGKPSGVHRGIRPALPCANNIQARPHRPVEEGDDISESFRELVTGEVESPNLDLVCARDRWNEIKKLVWPKLNSRQQMVLTLTYQSELNFPEIGKLLGVTRSLVHAIHREAIRVIRDEIARDGRLLKEGE